MGWAVAATVRPTQTFRLAPILIGLAPLLVSSKGTGVNSSIAAGASLIALGTALVLLMVDLLQGSSLLPFGGALTEAVVFAAATGGLLVGPSRLHSRRVRS